MCAERCQSFEVEWLDWRVSSISGLTACSIVILKEGVVIVQPLGRETHHLVEAAGISESVHSGRAVKFEGEEYLICAERRGDRLCYLVKPMPKNM